MKNVLKGSIFYVIIAIIVVLGINYIRGNLVENTGVTYSQFQKYVAQNKVSGVEVRQNSQGVTGELTVHLKDGEYRTLDVSDVTKAEDLLEQKNISYKVTVEKESVFMTTVLPMLLICVIFMVFFTMGSRQATGGNARMMNFGKSRATLTMPDNSKVTFKDVAGLQEEKEDLAGDCRFPERIRRNISRSEHVSRKVCCLSALREPVRPCWRKPWQEKRVFRSSAFPVPISWKCLSVSVHPVCVICLTEAKTSCTVYHLYR